VKNLSRKQKWAIGVGGTFVALVTVSAIGNALDGDEAPQAQADNLDTVQVTEEPATAAPTEAPTKEPTPTPTEAPPTPTATPTEDPKAAIITAQVEYTAFMSVQMTGIGERSGDLTDLMEVANPFDPSWTAQVMTVIDDLEARATVIRDKDPAVTGTGLDAIDAKIEEAMTMYLIGIGLWEVGLTTMDPDTLNEGTAFVGESSRLLNEATSMMEDFQP
jgi:hypothetical protein